MLAHFKLETNPFAAGLDIFRFFEIFNMDPAHPFSFDQTMVYIQFLLNEAGPDHQIIIEEAAHEALYRLSNGRVGQINTLMNQALGRAFTDHIQIISPHHVEDMGDEYDIFEEALAEDVDRNGLKLGDGAKISKPGHAVPIVAFAIVVLGLACVFWLFWESQQTQPLEKKTDLPKSAIQEPLKQTPESSNPTVVPAPEKKIGEGVRHSDERVTNFLAAYDLEVYERVFFDALYDENFEKITQQIYNETGLMLIHFTALPPSFENKYHILDQLLINPVHIRYFLFWKPSPVIPAWRYGAKGKSIQQVQTMLKKIGIYQGQIDGVVGLKLTRAILRFQRQNLLERTGTPDPTTLFFLTALSQ